MECWARLSARLQTPVPSLVQPSLVLLLPYPHCFSRIPSSGGYGFWRIPHVPSWAALFGATLFGSALFGVLDLLGDRVATADNGSAVAVLVSGSMLAAAADDGRALLKN